MKILKTFIISLLIPLTLILYFPKITFSEEGPSPETKVTEHPPESLSTPQEYIPKEKIKKFSFWKSFLVLGLIGGVAAAAAGGGGGGGDGKSNTGTVVVGW